MFVGHYAAAFAAKAIEPKTPLWTLAAGCQLIDVGWSSLIMAGVEHASADPALPGSTLVLYDMPWTHSLPGAAVWSVGAALACLVLLRLTVWPSVLVGLSVFSHWLLDLLVHRPDLQLYPNGPKVGFALWNYPVPDRRWKSVWSPCLARRGRQAARRKPARLGPPLPSSRFWWRCRFLPCSCPHLRDRLAFSRGSPFW